MKASTKRYEYYKASRRECEVGIVPANIPPQISAVANHPPFKTGGVLQLQFGLQAWILAAVMPPPAEATAPRTKRRKMEDWIRGLWCVEIASWTETIEPVRKMVSIGIRRVSRIVGLRSWYICQRDSDRRRNRR